MTKIASTAISAAIALLDLSSQAWAASCVSPGDVSALKTAVMQQELMVAALQCHEAAAYNRFVMIYRGELQASDANLKSFFMRRGGEHGEAGYDTFKTKAANLSALEQARDTPAFCADARALFTAAFNNLGSLMSFVDARSGGADLANIGNICAESRPVLPLLTKAAVRPQTAPVVVRTAETRPGEAAVGGVPAYSLPPIPYRPDSPYGVAPPPYQGDARHSYADAEEEDAPPPPRYYVPPPGYGWYPSNRYGSW